MSQVATYREKRQLIVARAYAAGGCPIHLGKQKCGETRGLDIIMDFHKLYQEKMSQIDVSAGGDTLQAKVDLQQEWINDLTEQNKMLAKVIEELELEAIGRVQQLEDKLKNAVKSFGEEDAEALAERDKKIKELEEALKAIPSMASNATKSEENNPSNKPEILSDEGTQAPRPTLDKDMVLLPNQETAEELESVASSEKIIKQSISLPVDEDVIEETEPTKEDKKDRSGSLPSNDEIIDESKILSNENIAEDSINRTSSNEKIVPLEEINQEPSELLSAKVKTVGETSSLSSKDETSEESNELSQQAVQEKVEEVVEQTPSLRLTAETKEEPQPAPEKTQEVFFESVPSQESSIAPLEYEETSEQTPSKPLGSDEIDMESLECRCKFSLPKPRDKNGKTVSVLDSVIVKKSSTGGALSAKNSSGLDKKSVHLVIGHGNDTSVIVEPEKNLNPPQVLERPELDSVPVVGTQDSLELTKGFCIPTPHKESSCVCFAEVYWDELERLREENKSLREGGEIQRLKKEIDEKMKRILQLNEENRALNDMINLLRSQAMNWSREEKEEYEYLKQKVKLLEEGKGDTDNITTNLQTAVDLYVNTTELLERSEEKLKVELENYKIMNEKIRDNLVSLNQELSEFKEQFDQEMEEQIWLNFILYVDYIDTQHTNTIYKKQIDKYQKIHEQLMELNYELEVEHVNSLQDLSMMETQFHKYQSFLKSHEEDKIGMKTQLKKLSKKNKCYEEVVQFFKEEMSVMSDELLTLQEVLNVTNVSSQEENNKLITAILQLRRINDRLVGHLCAIEKQVVIENQINQINEARINELQHIIGTKNNDLSQHDDIIQDMRKKLSAATKQNADLKKTIKNLTDTVIEIQDGIKSVERDQYKNKADVSIVESRVCLASGDLQEIKACMEQKNEKILELENQLKSQEVSLILVTKELTMLKEKKNNQKEAIKALKEEIAIAETKNKEITEDYEAIAKKLQDYNSLDHMKNYEVSHYKSLVEEMRVSLVEMNNGLEKCEASNIHFYEDLWNSDHLQEKLLQKKSNISVVFEELKKSMKDMKRRLSEANFKGGLIEEELLKVKESHMSQIQEEITENHREIESRIVASIEEQAKLYQLVEQQKEEIENLKKELQDEKENLCCCKRSVSELKNEKMNSNSEKEIAHLKTELNNSLQRQRLLNEENDKIHSQMINLRKKLTVIEHAYGVLKQEHEETKIQLKKTARDKECLVYKNQDLNKTVDQLRSTHDQLEKQCRYTSDCVRNLELELSEVQTEKDNISSEAQNLLRVVKLWLEEQQVVNGQIRDKFRNYNDTIVSLKQTMMRQMTDDRSWVKTPMQQPFSPRHYGTTPHSERRSASPTKTRRSEKYSSDAKYRCSSPWRCLSAYLEEDFLADDSHSHRSKLLRNISYDSNSSPFSSRSPSPRSNSMHGEEEIDELNLNDWFSPNYKETDTDADEMDDEPLVNKVHMMTAQVQEANKKWQQKMNKEHSTRYRASNK